jgi:serine/threonine protein kinase
MRTRYVILGCNFRVSKSDRLFARKLVRVFGQITESDILKDVQTIEKLRRHENLVQVLKHGWLPQSPFYFVDMDLCAYNLDFYIHSGKFQELHPSDLAGRESPFLNELDVVMQIMRQISSGLAFIHGFHEVHRDLHPRNGTFSP